MAGLSLKPNTPVDALMPYMDEIGLVLIMSVEPGFGGQMMIPETLKKLAALRAGGFKGVLSVDGGITAESAPQAVTMGATRLVMGTAVFRADDPAQVIRACQRLVP
jgi:ribulose-phosphate 3-epimerase